MASGLYIDALSLYYGSVRGTPYRWLDLEAVAVGLRVDPAITRIHYFVTADPDPGRQERQGTYLRALRTLNSVRVHEVDGVHPVAELSQKLLEDDRRGRHTLAVVLTNDGRLAEPISRLTRPCCVVLPRVKDLAHPAVREAGTFVRKLGQSVMETSLLDPVLADADGEILKPDGW
jgi:hypothetical protein